MSSEEESRIGRWLLRIALLAVIVVVLIFAAGRADAQSAPPSNVFAVAVAGESTPAYGTVAWESSAEWDARASAGSTFYYMWCRGTTYRLRVDAIDLPVQFGQVYFTQSGNAHYMVRALIAGRWTAVVIRCNADLPF